ncbi:MAG TPA: hypothetical protein VNL71_06430 [Chloroflexota bacterium]|nr:hypothetical protein [Chloroflexota bacterium]
MFPQPLPTTDQPSTWAPNGPRPTHQPLPRASGTTAEEILAGLPAFVTAQQLDERFGIDRHTISKAVKRGFLGVAHYGKYCFIPREEAKAFVRWHSAGGRLPAARFGRRLTPDFDCVVQRQRLLVWLKEDPIRQHWGPHKIVEYNHRRARAKDPNYHSTHINGVPWYLA